MKKSLSLILLIILLPPLIASVFVSIHVYFMLDDSYEGDAITFTIAPGEGFASINGRLDKAGLIPSARVFHYYSRYKSVLEKFKAGSYVLSPGANIPSIVDTFINGIPILNSVTIPEGKNMFEIGKLLESNKITTYEKFISAARSKELLAKYNIKAPSFEGYLFPDTYKFAPKTPAPIIIRTMLAVFDKKIKKFNFSKTKLTKHEVIILASIVEKETGAKFERPIISAVYLNRLKKRMRLQSDPTTIYGIYETFNGNLRRKHLLEKTAYNTYKLPALPLGPIANPSQAAIQAVLEPKTHKFIYFVSKNDGTHVFTETYKEHLRAVDYWQRNKRNRKGKSWRDLKQ
jgi:UPF0755 protein